MKTATKLWIGIGILILLSPLGLLLPEHFKAGDAWGEWGAGTFKELVGYIPQGLKNSPASGGRLFLIMPSTEGKKRDWGF